MDRENSISLLGITNFLQTGSLLRHQGQWVLLEGPFTPIDKPHSGEISVFCPDFYDLRTPALWKPHKQHRLSSDQLRSICEAYLAQNPASAEVPLHKSVWIEPKKEDFAAALSTIQKRIENGEIHKAVPIVFAQSAQTVTATERAQLILQLLKAPTTLYVYGFWQNGEGVLGATPEVLFDYQDGLLKTMALAGTCPKSESSDRESLLKDEKEMYEHRLVLEDICQVLGTSGEIKTAGPYIHELPTLYHLRTDIELKCHQRPDFFSLIEQLHPTPALGVAPRSAGYQWMKDLPGQEDRKYYGGPVAFLSEEQALCLVGIRNMQWNKNITQIGSGCGVVAASELEREWRELFQKRLSVRKILGLEL